MCIFSRTPFRKEYSIRPVHRQLTHTLAIHTPTDVIISYFNTTYISLNEQWVTVIWYRGGIMVTITLPEIPTGQDLEDFVAAYLQCGGFYTEKSLTERGETEVLELDIMAWKPADLPPEHTLFEVKGGGSGFSDIFKVLGWKTYLQQRGVNNAYLIAPIRNRTPSVIEYMGNKCNEIGIDLIAHEDPNTLAENLLAHGVIAAYPATLDHSSWRYLFWLERQMLKVVSTNRRTQQGLRGPEEIFAYQELIRSGFIQAHNVRERLGGLYQAHFEHPSLAKAVAAELGGRDWNSNNPPSTLHWEQAMFHCRHPLVHAAMYYQHRARLDILKGAVEFALLRKHNALPPEGSFNFLGFEIPIDILPTSFHSAVDQITGIEAFEKIPLLWQSFLWKWGGFFLVDYEEEEKAQLASEAGMSNEAANDAINLYDGLFPTRNGWLRTFEGAKLLMLFPCQF